MNEKVRFGIVVFIVAAAAGGMLAVFFQRFIAFAPVTAQHLPAPAESPGSANYDPPEPQDAPADIREAVMLGYNILNDTPKFAAAHVGNPLSCRNCHFNAGRTRGGKNGGISLVGAGATYPKFRKRQEYAVHLVTRTNDCFKRSMNGRPLPEDSREMTAIITYYQWLSKGLPVYGPVPWLGLPKLTGSRAPDAASGRTVFGEKCAGCHGREGEGSASAPPVWGAKSFNDGAGMARADTMASFVKNNMPLGDPGLSADQSIDVAAFATSQPRPHFVKR